MIALESAKRWSEVLLALALVQQSAEHLASHPRERILFGSRLLLALLLACGMAPAFVEAALILSGVFLLRRFDGPYHGGSDRMTLLLLLGLFVSHLLPSVRAREWVIGYVAVQVVLSYAMAGWVKLREPSWRDGEALRDVFAHSVYPVSERVREWANRPALLRVAGWGIVLFESLFPLALFDSGLLRVALAAAFGFHLANAALLGLNRFVWVWIAAYPLLLWFQARFFG